MSFNKYFKEELEFLRGMGKEFSSKKFSGSEEIATSLKERGTDPDVERVLEGFAFLSGQIRQKLDNEFPELTHGLMNLLWPHYLRPIPSISILEFKPKPGMVTEEKRIPKGMNNGKLFKGTEVQSQPVGEGKTKCIFRTCFDIDMYPVELRKANLERTSDGATNLCLSFQMTEGLTLEQVRLKSLRLYLHGDPAFTLYLWLSQYISQVTLHPRNKDEQEREIVLDVSSIQPAGFSKDVALLPYPKLAFDGYRLLQEYFAFREKFLFIDLLGLSVLKTGDAFDVTIGLTNNAHSPVRVTAENFRLWCTPIVNLFSHGSDPISVTHDRIEYLVRPSSSGQDIFFPSAYEIYQVESASGRELGTGKQQIYESFFSLKKSEANAANAIFYQTRLRESVNNTGAETFVAFVNQANKATAPQTETVAFDLTCTNRALAQKLIVGEINDHTSYSPEFTDFENITNVTPSVSAPLFQKKRRIGNKTLQDGSDETYWRLLSHLSLNYLSLSNVEALHEILELYNFQANQDEGTGKVNSKHISSIREIKTSQSIRIFRGYPITGVEVTLGLKEENFEQEGELFLFGSVLNEFFGLYASLNSFTQLNIRGISRGKLYQWKAKIGQQVLL